MSYLVVAEDLELIKKMAAGSEVAFRKLFDKYHQQLGRYIFQLTDSVELAEDIVQDVFLKIWLNKESLAGVSNFGGYLFIASKNQTLSYWRKQVKLRLNQEQLSVDYVQDLDDDATIKNCYNLIDEAIDKLPPQQRKVYLMSRHQRLKYSEIAMRMNLSTETVKKYLQIATASIVSHVQKNTDSVLILLFIANFL